MVNHIPKFPMPLKLEIDGEMNAYTLARIQGDDKTALRLNQDIYSKVFNNLQSWRETTRVYEGSFDKVKGIDEIKKLNSIIEKAHESIKLLSKTLESLSKQGQDVI